MFIELHILQNFAPSNLNRSDTGSPKDCEFGGHRRARISSQCLKRAIRKDAGFNKHLAGCGGGVRTRRLILEIAERLDGKPAPAQTVKMVSEVFNEGGLERPKTTKADDAEEKDNTRLILFMDRMAIDEMAERFKEHRPALTGKDKEAKSKIVEELGRILASSVKSPDIALFGRMIEIDSKKPFGKLQLGVDAACQVAHAISTNKTGIEFDYFTAVDDLLPAGETGAGMVGTAEFNSACFYRYANIDFNQLENVNLNKNRAGAINTVEAFIRSSIVAVPTGKQNSMAAQNPPSLVFAVARSSGLWSLANAFVKPVRPDAKNDLVENSITQLGVYWKQLAAMYGDSEIVDKCFVNLDGKEVDGLPDARVESIDELIVRMRLALEETTNETKGVA